MWIWSCFENWFNGCGTVWSPTVVVNTEYFVFLLPKERACARGKEGLQHGSIVATCHQPVRAEGPPPPSPPPSRSSSYALGQAHWCYTSQAVLYDSNAAKGGKTREIHGCYVHGAAPATIAIAAKSILCRLFCGERSMMLHTAVLGMRRAGGGVGQITQKRSTALKTQKKRLAQPKKTA